MHCTTLDSPDSSISRLIGSVRKVSALSATEPSPKLSQSAATLATIAGKHCHSCQVLRTSSAVIDSLEGTWMEARLMD